MRRPTLIIGSIVGVVLAVMWVVALQGPHPTEEIALDHGVSEITPLAGFVDSPNELSPSQVGVIVWIALFGLMGILAVVHRFMISAVRQPGAERTVTADGGSPSVSAPTWMLAGDRRIVEYYDASEDVTGLVAMGGLTILSIVFAALFTGEYLTLARTQYFGVYAAGMFFSLAGLTVAYYAWFMPHIEVVERRGH